MLQTLGATWVVILLVVAASIVLAERYRRTRFLWMGISIVFVCIGLGLSLYVLQSLRLL